MKIVLAIPAYNDLHPHCVTSLLGLQEVLIKAGIDYDIQFIGGLCYVSQARALLVNVFLNGNGTDLFFIDSDIAFSPEAAIKLIMCSEDIVGGTYLKKSGNNDDYAVLIKTTPEGYPVVGRNGLIEAEGLPTGFLKIKRHVFEKMQEAYPELKFKHKEQEVYDFFNTGVENERWYGDDFAFCKRWKKIGGQMWLMPDLDLKHIGQKVYEGNYHRFLLSQPKHGEALCLSV